MKTHSEKKRYTRILTLFICLIACIWGIKGKVAAADVKWVPFEGTELYLEWYTEEEGKIHSYWENMTGYAYIYCSNYTDNEYSLQITSKNPNIVEIAEEYRNISITPNESKTNEFFYKIKGVGKAVVEYRIADAVYEECVYVTPKSIDLKSIVQKGYQSATLTWEKVKGVSGYVIERTKAGQNYEDEKWQTVETVMGANTTSAVITTKWNTTYKYRVIGFVQADNAKLYGENYGSTLTFQPEKTGTALTSVKKTGNNALKLTWKKNKDAVGYKIYRSEMENDGYKLVKKITKGNVTSWQQKVTKGKVYYYRIVTVYPEGESDASASIAQMIPKKGKAKSFVISNLSLLTSGSNYGGNWANPDKTYYYQKSGKLHMVCVQSNGNLMDYTLNGKGKVTAKKKISLKYDLWGGFYKGTDGNFYVAVGYRNPQESEIKTVIKVIQYDNNWKKKKTAAIKGGASNAFRGIYIPFDAGNCSMTMQGETLYLFTAREMFKTPDGLHHQSNISFVINTKTMKAKEANESYSSHSFNQLAKFKDGNLYLMDHGDAYPRSIYLHTVTNYNALQKERNQKGQGGYTIKGKSVFNLQGETGDNYTGCTVGGMEIGKANILVCGTSVPHDYAIKGVTGSGWEYKENVYVVVTDRNMEKSQLKWLTNYHPKNSNVYIGDARMVKLNEERYAILYSVIENNVTTVKYLVINNAGKKVYSKDYKGMEFKGGSQPIIFNGNIVWAETSYKADYSGTETKLYSIPAVW